MEYGREEQAALTVHFRPHPACQFCLFGSAGFVYHPSLEWRVRHLAGTIPVLRGIYRTTTCSSGSPASVGQHLRFSLAP